MFVGMVLTNERGDDDMAKATTTTAADAKPESTMIRSFKAARRVSAPIVAIETPDPAATMDAIRVVLNGDTPTIQWDIVRGLVALNELGTSAMSGLGDISGSVNPVEALNMIDKLEAKSVVFFLNAHLQLGDTAVRQAVWNLRDVFKVNRRMLIMLGTSFQLPVEIAGDVVLLDEPLPTRAELGAVLDFQHTNAGLPVPTGAARDAALDALVGLPQFTAEQVTAMALTRNGMVVSRMWDRKIKSVESTPGLTVWAAQPGDTTLDELQGVDNVVSYCKQLHAANAFGAIMFIDEGDKAFAGGMADYSGDSGVAKDAVGVVLSWIENKKALGLMLAGVAGMGKTQLAKALGAASGKPVIVFDMNGMKSSAHGESERNIRTGLKVVDATAEGRVLVIMTANKTVSFTPELNRRFRKQFFFDTLSADARQACINVYAKKANLTAAQSDMDASMCDGWTGAEIKNACEDAALMGTTVRQAAKFIVPATVASATQIAELRRNAAGRFLSASAEGFYQPPSTSIAPVAPVVKGGRQVDLA